MGWLIDPGEQSVLVFLHDQPMAVYDEPSARLPVPTFAQDFELTVELLFGWLME